MRNIMALALLVTLTGCGTKSRGTDPLGPSAAQPASMAPAAAWTTVYTNGMNSTVEAGDYTGYTLGTLDPPITVFSSGAHSAPNSALYQGNSDGTAKTFYRNFTTSPTKIQATYWVYGIENGLSVGLVTKFGTARKAGFRLKINTDGSRDISIYQTASAYNSYWVSVASVPNVASSFNVWRAFKMSLDVATGLTDYYLDGVLVGSAINSNNCPTISAPTLSSAGWMSVFNFAAVGGTVLKIDDITLETK